MPHSAGKQNGHKYEFNFTGIGFCDYPKFGLATDAISVPDGRSAPCRFQAFGKSHVFSDYWFRNPVIEYRKDIKIYVVTTGTIADYRHVRATRTRAPAATVRTDRMVVQTDKGESIIRRDDIEYLEAARNYVAVSTGARDFLVRTTFAKLEEELVAESDRAHTPQLPGQHRQDRGDPHD